MARFGLGAILGALGFYFLDPQSGRRRRHVVRIARSPSCGAGAEGVADGTARRRGGNGDQGEGTPARGAEGLRRRHARPKGRDGDLPRAGRPERSDHVSAADGVVALRGEVERPEVIDDLVERVRRVHGVRDLAISSTCRAPRRRCTSSRATGQGWFVALSTSRPVPTNRGEGRPRSERPSRGATPPTRPPADTAPGKGAGISSAGGRVRCLALTRPVRPRPPDGAGTFAGRAV